jgi:lauroyl/myristoyl acyltransferase
VTRSTAPNPSRGTTAGFDRAVLRLSDAVGRLEFDFVRREPTPAQTAEFFPDLSPRRAVEVSREIAAARWRDRWLDRMARRGGAEAAAALVRCFGVQEVQDRASRRAPTILLFAHLGPRFAAAAGLTALGLPALLMVPPQHFPLPERLELLAAPTADGSHLALGLKRGLERLARGELVAVPVDGDMGMTAATAAFLGRRVRPPRGPAVLARLSGAPAFPIVTVWDRSCCGLELRVFPPLSVPAEPTDGEAFDGAFLAAALAFFERFHRQHPEQLRPERMRRMQGMARPEAPRGGV